MDLIDLILNLVDFALFVGRPLNPPPDEMWQVDELLASGVTTLPRIDENAATTRGETRGRRQARRVLDLGIAATVWLAVFWFLAVKEGGLEANCGYFALPLLAALTGLASGLGAFRSAHRSLLLWIGYALNLLTLSVIAYLLPSTMLHLLRHMFVGQ